ncbi:MAG: TonB family protein [Sulfuricella denitrificans]|nr:TonB family protein [Sulfuricella denitrificans]
MARSGAEAAEKMALSLAASLLLHFALIFGLQIRSVPAVSHASPVIQARLVEVPQITTVKSPEPSALLVKTQEPAPLPLPLSEPAVSGPPAPAPPASAATPESSEPLPSIEMPLIEDTKYYPAVEVDVHPSALQVIQPRYPDEAAGASVAGSVVLVLLLDESGKVQALSVEEASPPGVFEQSAMDAFRNARFSPAQRNGRVVKSRVRIKVSYELTGKSGQVDKGKQK